MIWASKVHTFNSKKKTCLNDIFTCPPPQKDKRVIFVLTLTVLLYVHKTLLACPIQATVTSRSFKMLAQI